MPVKQTLLSLALVSLFISCDQIKDKQKVPDERVIEQPEEQTEEIEIPESSAVVIPDVPLGFLVTYEGKYATQERLFENELIANRLKNLKRFNYDALLQNYNTETPVIIINNIVHMSGCKQHDCPSSAYDFFIDLDNDNVNVYHFRSNMLRIYQENGLIELPDEFTAEMETKKSNAGIGDPSSIESKYTLE